MRRSAHDDEGLIRVRAFVHGLLGGLMIDEAVAVNPVGLSDREHGALALVDQAPLIAMKLDSAGRCVFINKSAERILGKSHSYFMGLPLYAAFGCESRDQLGGAPGLEKALHGEQGDDCIITLTTSEGVREYLVSFTPGGSNEAGHYEVFVVGVDISAHHEVLSGLQESMRVKERFIAMLAHEFRNPLSSIASGLKVLERSSDPVQTQQTREMMERQVRHLNRLVSDLLDVSRIKQGKISLTRSQSLLSDIVALALDTSRTSVNNGEHALHVAIPNEPIELYVDSTRLAQIISNLLDNAAKYTPPKGSITLNVSKEGDTLHISVSDNGVGIPEDRLKHIFEAYAQLEQKDSRTAGGLGIGLYLVKMFAEAHGGSIEVRSDGDGQGSEFVVRIPLTCKQ
jgi:signal transduction histidine kinase